MKKMNELEVNETLIKRKRKKEGRRRRWGKDYEGKEEGEGINDRNKRRRG